MKYNIKVGEKWLIGESVTETIKGTVRGDTTAVFSRMVGEMSAYDFADNRAESSSFDRITLCDYLRGIIERQNYGHYLGEIKVIPEEMEEVETQLPKRGKWITIRLNNGGSYTGCSCCEAPIPTDTMLDYIPESESKYCYSCGAKMTEVQE